MRKSYGEKVLKKVIAKTKKMSKKDYNKLFKEAKKRENIVIYSDKDIDKIFHVSKRKEK